MKQKTNEKKDIENVSVPYTTPLEIEETIKKSMLNARDRFDYQKLAYSMSGLLPCTYEEELEEVIFRYQIEGKKSLHEIVEEDKEHIYQLLINFYGLWDTLQNYKISFRPDNFYYDENYMLYAKSRDIYRSGQKPDENEFLEVYQSMVGGLLSSRYSIEQIQESGLNVLKNEKGFESVCASESAEELVSLLRVKKKELITKRKESLREVRKSVYLRWRIAAILFAVLSVGCGAYSIYASQMEIPRQQAVIAANQAYIASDYVACIDNLKAIEPDKMDRNTKYILAVAYANSESFKREEIETIVEKLTPSSNEKELDYWIYLGRLEVEKAEDIALSLSDDKLLIYAYMKESDLLESNTDISGEEKKERLDKLEQEITKLGKKYEETGEADEKANTSGDSNTKDVTETPETE